MIESPATWIELSRNAFEHNLASYRAVVGNKVAFSVVVKSNAYGHGLREMARLCQESCYVDWLCVTSLSEALLVRSYGVTKPVLVLSLLDADPELAIKQEIDITVFDLKTVQHLNELGKALQKKVNIHLKVDTGMSRLGFFPEEVLLIMREIAQLRYIVVRGILTHFSESSNKDQTFTQQQLRIFNDVLQELKKNDIQIPYIHVSNSGAVAHVDGGHFNMVRLGAGAYGIAPPESACSQFSLKQVMSWKTKIFHISTIPAGSYVGY